MKRKKKMLKERKN